MKIVLSKRYWGIELNREHCAEVPILFGWSTRFPSEGGLNCLSEGARKPFWLGRMYYDFWGWRWLFMLIPFNVICNFGIRVIYRTWCWLRTGHLPQIEFEKIRIFKEGYDAGVKAGKNEAAGNY